MRKRMLASFSKFIPQNASNHYLYMLEKALSKSHAIAGLTDDEPFEEMWNSNTFGSGNTLIFYIVNIRMFVNAQAVSNTLRTKGIKTIGIYLNRKTDQDDFDVTYQCNGDVANFLRLSTRLKKYRSIVQTNFTWAYIAPVLMNILGVKQCAVELNDWFTSFVPPGKEQRYLEEKIFSEQEIELTKEVEQWLWQNSELLITKNRPAFSGPMPKGRLLRLYPSLPLSMMLPPQRKKVPGKRMVYAGQLKEPGTAPNDIFGDIVLNKVGECLINQSFEVTFIIPDTTKEHLKKNYPTYLKLSEQHNSFNILPGISRADLIRYLNTEADIGLIIHDFSECESLGKEHVEGALATKYFTYIAAGIPVIVSEELRDMAQITKEFNLGIVIGLQQWPNLKTILADLDLNQYNDSIAEFQKKAAMEKQIGPLVEWFEKASIR